MAFANQKLFEWIFGASGENAFVDALAVFFAKYLPYFLVGAALWFVFSERGFRRRALMLCEGLLATILSRGIVTEVIRFFYHYPRPFEALGIAPLIQAGGYSFPSGHAAFFFALATTVFFWDRKWGTWFFALEFVNSLARIFSGVHWPLDIVGGFLIGVGSAILVHMALSASRAALGQHDIVPSAGLR